MNRDFRLGVCQLIEKVLLREELFTESGRFGVNWVLFRMVFCVMMVLMKDYRVNDGSFMCGL